MLREPHIPLILWLATALLVHVGWYGGTDGVARWWTEQRDLGKFAARVIEQVRAPDETVEIALLTPEQEPEATPTPEAPPDEATAEDAPTVREKEKPSPPEPRDPDVAELLVQKVEPRRAPEKPEASSPEPPNVLPVQPDRRVAVVQHAEDNQPDNPDAEFIGDKANKVKEQTQARITQHGRDDPDPNPGTNHAGPEEEVGNADETRIGHGDDAPDKPGISQPSDPRRVAAVAPPPLPQRQGGAPPPRPAPAAREEQAGRAAQAAQDPSPDTLTAPGGGPEVAPRAREGRPAVAARPAVKRRLPPPPSRPGTTDWLAFGASSMTPNGINLNLAPRTAVAAVGADQLALERKRDGERLRSKHRGAFKSRGMERWRAAIENYVASVKPGNQTALNTARVPFANYLHRIHDLIHPLFADAFLVSLDSLPASHPMNRMDMAAHLEIVVDRDEGRLVRMGVTKTSGVTAFDIGALESVDRAAPFGKPPAEIVSPDGNVYLHWEFHRRPVFACSTYFAHPYILKATPSTAPPKISPPRIQERPPTERQGRREDGSTDDAPAPVLPPREPARRPVDPGKAARARVRGAETSG